MALGNRKRLLLWAAGVLTLVVAMIGIRMIRRGFSARQNPSQIEMFVAKTARSMAVPAKAKRMKNPLPSTAENIAEARAHWADHCAVCHANNGSGNTTIGQNLYPKAPDMRLAATQSMTDGELYYTIQNGIRLSGMPAWGQIGENDEDSWKLVHFIRHLPQLTTEEEKEMERLNPKGPEERQEEQEEEQFLNQDQPKNQVAKPSTHQNH
ncbi:MAG TPA: c-type cytochrome [Terriglobales bacterium]|nr:c-type cytochrome [Terriglobales bacterium]